MGGGLRDVIVTLVVFGAIPMVLRRPWLGILLWSWLAYMNPHKLSYGFAHNFPFSKIAALITLAALLGHKGPKRIPWERETILIAALTGWQFITTFSAFFPDAAWLIWDKVWKIVLFTFVTMMLIDTKEKINALLWTIVISLGLYGVKGGIFTLATGGSYKVYGPVSTFIGGNNSIGLALLMVIPWMRYFQLTVKNNLIRIAMGASIGITMLAIIGTYSRGALVGTIVVMTVMFAKNLRHILFLFVAAGVLYGAVQFMPESWHNRMGTIKTYKKDQSAMGRINAWWMAFNLAKDHPFVGGGFDTFQAPIFKIYAPEPNNVHDAHSIYFEILGEQGFVGLGLFLALGLSSLLSARRIMKLTKGRPEWEWMYHLGSMMQVSLLGYASSGAFLGLSHFDLYYAEVAIIVICKDLIRRELQGEIQEGKPESDTASRERALAPRT